MSTSTTSSRFGSIDRRLARVVCSADPCVFELWLLTVDRGGADECTTVLYGRVTKYNWAPGEWYGPRNGDPLTSEFHKLEITRLALYASGGAITHLVSNWLAGDNLATATEGAGLTWATDRLTAQYGNVVLAGVYALRPVVLLRQAPTRFESSPSTRVGFFGLSQVMMDKSEVIVGVGPDALRPTLCVVAEYLQRETGFGFTGNENGKLGNIDWLDTDTWDHTGRPLVHLRHWPDFITVSFDSELNWRDTVRVVVSVFNGGLLVEETMVEIDLCNTRHVNVPRAIPNEIVDSVELKVFRGSAETTETAFSLAHFHEEHYIRQIAMSIDAAEATGTLPSSWLEKYAQGHSDRLVAAQQIRQSRLMNSFTIGDRSADPWVPALSKGRERAVDLFPRPTGARFFHRHFVTGAGRLEFAEWLYEVLAEKSAGLMIFDPYFDSAGLELMSRRGRPDCEYVVVTAGDFKNKDDRFSKGDSEVRGLHKTSQLLGRLLAGLKLQVKCLPRNSFHDRYIFTLNASQQVIAGYHLSNSIQQAAENHPLLVTPIPANVLDDVFGYASSLLALTDEDGTPKARSVFDSRKGPKPSSWSSNAIDWWTLCLAGLVVGKWLGRWTPRFLPGDLLKQWMVDEGFTDASGDIREPAHLAHADIVKSLVGCNEWLFDRYWRVLGEAQARLDPDEVEKLVALVSQNTKLTGRLKAFIGKYIKTGGGSFGSDAHSWSNFLSKSFANTLAHIQGLNTFISFSTNVPYPVAFAIECVGRQSGRDLAELAQHLFLSAVDEKENLRAAAVLSNAFHVMAEPLHRSLAPNLVEAFAKSAIPAIRALAVCGIEEGLSPQAAPSLTTLGYLLGELSPEDEEIAAGWLVHRAHHTAGAWFRLLAEHIRGLVVSEPYHFSRIAGRCAVVHITYKAQWFIDAIIHPLVGRGLDLDEVVQFWVGEWVARAEMSMSDQGSTLSNEIEDAIVDTGLWLAACSTTVQATELDRLEHILNDADRAMLRPFARSHSEQWDAAAAIVSVVYGILWSWDCFATVRTVKATALLDKARDLADVMR